MASPFVNDDGYCDGFMDGATKPRETGSSQQFAPAPKLIPDPDPATFGEFREYFNGDPYNHDGSNAEGSPDGSSVVFKPVPGVSKVRLLAPVSANIISQLDNDEYFTLMTVGIESPDPVVAEIDMTPAGAVFTDFPEGYYAGSNRELWIQYGDGANWSRMVKVVN